MLANYIKKHKPNAFYHASIDGVIRIRGIERERERENKVDMEVEDEKGKKEYIKNSAVQDYAAKVRNQVV